MRPSVDTVFMTDAFLKGVAVRLEDHDDSFGPLFFKYVGLSSF